MLWDKVRGDVWIQESVNCSLLRGLNFNHYLLLPFAPVWIIVSVRILLEETESPLLCLQHTYDYTNHASGNRLILLWPMTNDLVPAPERRAVFVSHGMWLSAGRQTRRGRKKVRVVFIWWAAFSSEVVLHHQPSGELSSTHSAAQPWQVNQVPAVGIFYGRAVHSQSMTQVTTRDSSDGLRIANAGYGEETPASLTIWPNVNLATTWPY